MSAFGAFTVARAGTKRVLNSSGVLAQVANNVPAFEFNTDGTYRGLLVEPAGTNLCLQSENFTTTWSNNGSTDTANTTVAPDGATTADTVTGNGTDTTVYVQQNITFAGAGTYTFSCWAKAGTHDIIRVNIANYVGSTSNITGYNLTNGTTTVPTNPIVAYPNGWYRISFTFTVVGGDLDGSIRIFLSPSTGTTAWSVAGDSDTKSVILWGAQLEAGSVSTSYIPTVASTANRVADSVTLTGASSLIGQSAGYAVVEVNMISAGINRGLISLNDGTNDNRMSLQVGGGNTVELRVVTATVLQGASSGVAISDGVQRWGFRYSASGCHISRNGSTVSTIGAITVPATSRIDAFQAVAGAQFNGWGRYIVMGNTDITEAQLNALTA